MAITHWHAGDKVERIAHTHNGMKVGDVGIVQSAYDNSVGEWGTGHNKENFRLVSDEQADNEFRETTFGRLPDANGPDTTTSKASNPKQAFGDLKAQLGLVPDTLTYFAAAAFFEGASKYGAYNWRVAGVRASTYKAAAERHLKKWFSGEEVDPVTGVPHLANAIACLGIIVDAEACGKLEDDRPPALDLGTVEARVAAIQAGLREQHKDKSPTHWTQAALRDTQ
jgi:hypothetical protein